MKGLLLKDFYLCCSVLYLMVPVVAILGVALSLLVSTWVLVVLSTVMFGMIAVSTINMDRVSGWQKVSAVLPLSRARVVDSKYTLYLLLSGAGFLLGLVVGGAVSGIQSTFDWATMGIYLAIGVDMALMAGSFTIPLSFLLGEEKNVLAVILAYPIAAAAFVGIVVPLGGTALACALAAAVGAVCYLLSWMLARKGLAAREVTG
ncbi:ABC-2 transporter permease [Evtepia sp.]